MIKFFDEEKNQIESPFDEVVSLKSFPSLSFSIDEGKEMSIKDIFYLRLNSKNEYSLYLFFPKENVNRDALLNKIEEQRETEFESNKDKAVALFKLVNEYKPIYSRYISRSENFLNEQEVKSILPNTEFEIKIPEPTLPPLTEKEIEEERESAEARIDRHFDDVIGYLEELHEYGKPPQIIDSYINACFVLDEKLAKYYLKKQRPNHNTAEDIRNLRKENKAYLQRIKELEYLISERWPEDVDTSEKRNLSV